ncbi:M48 family metallopeptidase [Candidatus Woesearchaeota archaeon]|nr:M48 family metallopeptidase [Candidatus Woesearchaeota archaeon]
MSLVKLAYQKLYPDSEFPYDAKVSYSGRFSDYNAKVIRQGNSLEFRLSRKWLTVSEEIKLGLIQHLLLRLGNDRRSTFYTDLYSKFVKNLHISVGKTESEPELLASFSRVNDEFFHGTIEQPNLRWGSESVRKLASYDYQSDTITVSSVFLDEPEKLLDYVMFHELLHKALKFRDSGTKTIHHSSKFRQLESSYPGHEALEKALERLARKNRIADWL